MLFWPAVILGCTVKFGDGLITLDKASGRIWSMVYGYSTQQFVIMNILHTCAPHFTTGEDLYTVYLKDMIKPSSM